MCMFFTPLHSNGRRDLHEIQYTERRSCVYAIILAKKLAVYVKMGSRYAPEQTEGKSLVLIL